MEEWRDIVGYVGLYQVSSLGRVKSIARISHGGDKKRTIYEDAILVGKNARGYRTITLCHHGYHRYQIHRLVADAFIPNHENKPQVNHKNGVKDDNRVSNLEWVTASENKRHAFETGLAIGVRGSKSHLAKLTEDQVIAIRLWRKSGSKLKEIASVFNISDRQVSAICLGKRWGHLKDGDESPSIT